MVAGSSGGGGIDRREVARGGGAAKFCCNVEKGGLRDLETLLAVDAEVPGRTGGCTVAEGVDWFRLWVLAGAAAGAEAGAAAFLGPVEVAEVESVDIDTGRREVVVDVVAAVAVPLLSLKTLGAAAILELAAVEAVIFLSVAEEALVLVLAVLVLRLRFGGADSFFSPPLEVILVRFVLLLRFIDLFGTTFFSSSLFSLSLFSFSFKSLVPTVRLTTVLSFPPAAVVADRVVLVGGGIRALSADPLSDGVPSRLVLDLDEPYCWGDGSRDEVDEDDCSGGSVGTVLKVGGVGSELLRICLAGAAGGDGVEGEGVGSDAILVVAV